jgi:thioredoxin-related protein
MHKRLSWNNVCFTVIAFVYSNQMPLSMRGKMELERIQKNFPNLTVNFYQDPNDPKKTGNRTIPLDLIKLGALNHFPTLILYSTHSKPTQMIPGYLKQSELVQILNSWTKK